MANFNTSAWYQLQLGGNAESQSMVGTGLYDAGKGAVFFAITNTTDPQQMWQLFPYNSTYYVLRTKESGQFGYMTAAAGGSTPGNTVPIMRNVTIADDSMFWSISPWGDGTFYLANAANGTDWHLQVRSNSLLSMSSNITVPQSGQRFSFNEQDSIVNEPGFSTVALPAALSTSTPTASPTTASPAIPTSTNSSGLSTGAKAGIGAGVGIVALIALLALGFFFLRRRKTGAQSPSSFSLTSDFAGERKSMVPSKPQQLATFSEVDGSENTRNPALAPQELDPTAISMHEMEAGRDKERKGGSVNPYRPVVDSEQKAVMPQGFFRENAVHEMDAQQHSMRGSEFPGEAEERGRLQGGMAWRMRRYLRHDSEPEVT